MQSRGTIFLIKLLEMVRSIYEMHPYLYPYISRNSFQAIKVQLLKRWYLFRPMYRSFIPKPKKPEQLRPITQPAKEDPLVLGALARLLNKGARSFLKEISRWTERDFVILLDVVKCFDRIPHQSLLSFLEHMLGRESTA